MAPFDPQKGAFWLIAIVIGVHALIILGFGITCIYHSELILSASGACDPNNRLMSLMAAALAAALAFAGIKGDKDK